MQDKETRINLCRDNHFLFALWYFTEYFTYKTPKFHMDFYEDYLFKDWHYVLHIAFRESAKTSLAKVSKLVHNIAYHRREYNVWVSFDESKAKSNLYDVTIALQTNQRLIEDFGQLYFEDKTANEGRQKSEKKSVGEFVCSNGVKVKAFSVLMSIRGEVAAHNRPDAYFIDDIETSKTMNSEARTQQVKDFIDELLSGAAGDAEVLILANRIINNGSIAYLEDKLKNNPDARIRDVPVEYEDGSISWPDKYVATDAEAAAINATIEDRKLRKISLEAKKRTLGLATYSREMLNKPLSDATREFQMKWLEQRFSADDIRGKTLNRFVMVDDKQGSKKKEGDSTGLVVLDVDADDNWYIRFVKGYKLDAPGTVDLIFDFWRLWKPIKMGVEKLSFEYQMAPYIRMKSEKENVYPVVEELMHGGTNKEDRIRGALLGRARAGKLWFREDDSADDTLLLIQQLFDFPQAKHDDLSDALAYGEQFAFRPYFSGKKEKKMTTLEEEMRMYREQDAGPRESILNDLL